MAEAPDMQSGTYLGYGKLTYTRGALRMQFFTNVLNGQAPNLLLPDLATEVDPIPRTKNGRC